MQLLYILGGFSVNVEISNSNVDKRCKQIISEDEEGIRRETSQRIMATPPL